MSEDALTQILTAFPGGRRSPLYRMMRENHANLAREFSLYGANWGKRVLVMAQHGWTDRRGNPPSIKTAQKTWYRVCRDVAQDTALPASPIRAVPDKLHPAPDTQSRPMFSGAGVKRHT